MRSDMFKVIVERPRCKFCYMYSKRQKWRRRKESLLDGPRFESMAPDRKGHRKHLNENLAPLYRFLEKNLGRPWDDVYSEICSTIRLEHTVQRHVRQHADDSVERSVWLVDGVPHAACGRRPLLQGRFYVCPATRRLERVPVVKGLEPAKPTTLVKLGPNAYWKIRGHWFFVRIAFGEKPTITTKKQCSRELAITLEAGLSRFHSKFGVSGDVEYSKIAGDFTRARLLAKSSRKRGAVVELSVERKRPCSRAELEAVEELFEHLAPRR